MQERCSSSGLTFLFLENVWIIDEINWKYWLVSVKLICCISTWFFSIICEKCPRNVVKNYFLTQP